MKVIRRPTVYLAYGIAIFVVHGSPLAPGMIIRLEGACRCDIWGWICLLYGPSLSAQEVGRFQALRSIGMEKKANMHTSIKTRFLVIKYW